MNDEDIQKVATAVATILQQSNKPADPNAGGNPAPGDDKNKQPAGNNFSEEEVRRRITEEQQAKNNEEVMKNSIRFNLGVDAFIEKNKAFLPSTLGDLIKKAQETTFSNESQKARSIQKLMLDEVFSKQEAVDLLPDTLKTKLSGYKALADDEKLKRALDYYDLVETYSLLKKGQTAKEFNGGVSDKDKSYEDKFFGAGKK